MVGSRVRKGDKEATCADSTNMAQTPRPIRRTTTPPRLPVGELPHGKTKTTTPAHAGHVIDDDTETPHDHTNSGNDVTTSPRRSTPTPHTSGDKKLTRDATPRRDLVTFEDNPDHKPLTNKRKRTRLNKGGMFFNARDREIILLIAAHGWADKQQIAALLGNVSADSTRKSLKRLVDHDLLDAKFGGFIGQNLYTVTAFGLRKAGAEGFTSTITPRVQTMEHTDAITALHIYMRTQTAGNPNRVFITEKELQAAATSGVLTPRVLTTHPWAAAYTDFTRWIPSTVSEKGNQVYKRPDGLVLTYAKGTVQPPEPVEIERTIKTRFDYYQQAFLMYANAAKNEHLSNIVIYFAPAATGTHHELETALANVYNPTFAKFRWPANLPKIEYKVFNLDTIYTPYSAIRGLIPGKPSDNDE